MRRYKRGTYSSLSNESPQISRIEFSLVANRDISIHGNIGTNGIELTARSVSLYINRVSRHDSVYGWLNRCQGESEADLIITGLNMIEFRAVLLGMSNIRLIFRPLFDLVGVAC